MNTTKQTPDPLPFFERAAIVERAAAIIEARRPNWKRHESMDGPDLRNYYDVQWAVPHLDYIEDGVPYRAAVLVHLSTWDGLKGDVPTYRVAWERIVYNINDGNNPRVVTEITTVTPYGLAALVFGMTDDFIRSLGVDPEQGVA